MTATSDLIIERRQMRRRLAFWRILAVVALLAVAIVVLPRPSGESRSDHVARISIDGMIFDDPERDARLAKLAEDSRAKAVILRINSPGGTVAGSEALFHSIRAVAEKKPVVAVMSEVAASGGYVAALAADHVIARTTTITGSIGVRIDSFGFQQAMEELGIERRLLTAGDNKGILDPFSPLREDQRDFLLGILERLHGQFIAEVREGRGDRLKGGDEIFSGLFWSGEQAVDLGLADAFGSSSYVAREVIKAEKIVDFTKEKDLLAIFADRLGSAMARALFSTTGSGLPVMR